MLQYTAPILLLAFASATAADKATIDDDARDFRIQTYDNFRLNRPEYNRRRELADEAIRRFKKADAQQRQQLVEWFAQSLNGSISDLPGGEFRTTDQIADDAVDAATKSIDETDAAVEDANNERYNAPVIPTPREQLVEANEPAKVNDGDEDEYDRLLRERGLDEDEGQSELSLGSANKASQTTSIVKTDKFGIQSQSRTFSILGSVGRAVTSAVASGAASSDTDVDGRATNAADNEAIADEATEENSDTTEENTAIEATPTPAAPSRVPTATDEESFDYSDEDLNLEELILESPSNSEALEPTPETFEREAQWKLQPSARFAQRVEQLEQAIHRVAVRLDMSGMTVEQTEGAVELAEEMCWHYQTLATYLNATGGDKSVVDSEAIRTQVDRLQTRLNKGLTAYRTAVQKNPSISRHIVKIEELILRTQLLRDEVSAEV